MKTTIRDIVLSSISLILERFEREADAYPFIDTKFDIVSGRDYGETDEPFRQRGCIYSWIQGRGLESLAKHAEYAEANGKPELAKRLMAMLATVVASMEKLRHANDGRLPFAMHLDGSSFFQQPPSQGNFSDLFYSKGLFAAGRVLRNKEYIQAGRKLFEQVLEAIRNREFRTDQQSFDPKNQVAYTPGKYPQGPRMIALGGIADFLEAYPQETLWQDIAEEYIQYIFQHHINLGAYPELQKYDFIESLDSNEQPWRDGAVIFSDPGHALEFTGLAGKCILKLQRRMLKTELLQAAASILPQLFCHVFDYGFNRKAGGISKGFDLVSRTPTNGDMPWWSLPETVRAGLELAALYPTHSQVLLPRTGMAFQAFTQGFLQANGFACQTRSASGDIIHVIPAVSDADPGYHTNLSLMDAEALLP